MAPGSETAASPEARGHVWEHLNTGHLDQLQARLAASTPAHIADTSSSGAAIHTLTTVDITSAVCKIGAVHILRQHFLGSLDTLGGVVSTCQHLP